MIKQVNEIEIGVIAGCVGSGKTKECINLAMGYMSKDKKVLHITTDTKESLIKQYKRYSGETRVDVISDNLSIHSIRGNALMPVALVYLLEQYKPSLVVVDCQFHSQFEHPIFEITKLLGEVSALCVSFKTSMFIVVQTNREKSMDKMVTIQKRVCPIGGE